MIEYLVKYGASVDEKDDNNETLLMYVCKNGFEIIDQDCCVASNKCYTVLLVQYSGEPQNHGETFFYLGRLEPQKNGRFSSLPCRYFFLPNRTFIRMNVKNTTPMMINTVPVPVTTRVGPSIRSACT